MSRHQVVVLGGGFAGISAVRALRNAPAADVTLIDRRNFHLFQPLLYQVATGSLAPGDISSPLRSIFSRQANARVLMGLVQSINPGAHTVSLTGGREIRYDTLIVALGSTTSYFGHDEWRKYAWSIKTIEEALEICRRIFSALRPRNLKHPVHFPLAHLRHRRRWGHRRGAGRRPQRDCPQDIEGRFPQHSS
jgi:NADH:ubiquinone reductase (H+-translocating)